MRKHFTSFSSPKHLYVHVPFCARRCSYCDFAIAVRRAVPVEEFVEALGTELELRLADGARLAPLSTVYLGGGTPSKLGPAGIERLLDRIRAVPEVAVEAGAEVTIEANPEDVTPGAIARWKTVGVNRVSLGVQTFDASALSWMHRTHDSEASRRAVAALREGGIADLSLDLIFALPDHLHRDWEADLSQAMALEPDHLSLYGLTVEPHTPLGRWAARGEVEEATEESYGTEYLLAHAALSSAGFEHYEVSNFARDGHRSRHNSAYWRRSPYLGAGPSAHSFDGVERRWNEREFASWSARVERREDPRAGSECLTRDNEIAEVVYLGLRTAHGLQVEGQDREVVDGWVREGWAKLRDDRIVLTPEGWLRLDGLAASLTASRSR